MEANCDEKPSGAPIVLKESNKRLTGKQAADHLMKSFEAVRNLNVPKEKERAVLDQQNQVMSKDTEKEVIMKTFTEKELEGLHQLQKEKSPGSNGITEKSTVTPRTISKNDNTEDLHCQLE